MKKSVLLLVCVFLLSAALVESHTIVWSNRFFIQTTGSNQVVVPIYIKNATNLYALKFDLSFDPTVIRYNRSTEGGFLSETGQKVVLDNDDFGLIDTTTPGKVRNIIFSRTAVNSGVSGNGQLFTLLFNTLKTGVAQLTCTDIQLSDPDGNPITDYLVYQLNIWDDTDQGTPKAANQSVNFYATLEDGQSNPIITTCQIDLGGVRSPMAYQSAGHYLFTASFKSAGTYPWSVVCENVITSQDSTLVLECADGTQRQCSGSSTGECRPGTQTCTSGVWGVCQGILLPATELCDNKDNDCDGQTDEGLTSPVCSLQSGICSGSVKVCGGANGWLTCTETQYGLQYQMTETTCDGKDNDCDSQIDEGCACMDGSQQTCGITDISPCRYGLQTCEAGGWGACEGTINPAEEVCDNKDNDCDGSIDENLNTPCGTGVCAGTKACSQGVWSSCSTNNNDCGICARCDAAGACSVFDTTQSSDCAATSCPDACNLNPDNNPYTWDYAPDVQNNCLSLLTCTHNTCSYSHACNKSCGAECVAGEAQSSACGSDVGECSSGQQSRSCTSGCTWSDWGQCIGAINSTDELCDGKDNDCDNQIDEGCACVDGSQQACGTTNTTPCRYGLQNCSSGSWGACEGAINPAEEVCDNKDNDCDGSVDEEVCVQASGGGGDGSSGGGGSTSGGGHVTKSCDEQWRCDEWGACAEGAQTRSCTDANKCKTNKNKPITSQPCEDTPIDPCANGLQDNDEAGVDCGGSCAKSCTEQPGEELAPPAKQNDKITIQTSPEEIKQGKILVSYDNSDTPRASGVFFKFDIKDGEQVIAEEYLGPMTVEEDKLFEQSLSMPLYLLQEGKEYELATTVTEKGKPVGNTVTTLVIEESPMGGFASRVGAVFLIVCVLMAISAILFINYLKRGDKE